MNKSKQYLSVIEHIWNKEVSGNVLERAKRSLLDYIAVTCAGTMFQKDKIAGYFDFAEPEPGIFKVIGTGKTVTLKDAVFLNGLNAHALDYDDGTNSGIIHLGSPVFSLLVPLAQRYDICIGDMLRAAIVGYEASYTMAVSIQPGHKAMGYHASGTCGTLGATIAASYMLGFSEEEKMNAFSAACVSASGMLKALDDGSELKPYNVAKASLLALTSLQMARAGFRGSTDPLGGRGFIRMMTGRDDVAIKPVLLNGTFAIEKSYTKPYASCRYTHPAVEAAIRMRKVVEIDDIQEIEIVTYDLAVSGHDHTDISGSYSAKMSIPYATAAGLYFGKAGLQEFSEDAIMSPGLLRLTGKIKVRADETLSKAFPDMQSAIVTIKTDKGEYTEKVDYPKGEPENPLNEKEFTERYYALMDYAGIGRDTSTAVYKIVNCANSKVKGITELL